MLLILLLFCNLLFFFIHLKLLLSKILLLKKVDYIDNLKFISNNVKRIQKSRKRNNIFEYLKNSISPNGFTLFMKHNSTDDVKRRCDKLNGNSYFSHGKISSCGVAIAWVGSKSFVLVYQTAYKNGRLLLIETIVDDVKFVVINIYDSNTESQLLALTELHKILQNVYNTGNWGRF